MFLLLRNQSSNGVLKEIGPQNGGRFWTDEKKETIVQKFVTFPLCQYLQTLNYFITVALFCRSL